MTLRTRIRKIIKWSALTMTIALLVCWIGSNWFACNVFGTGTKWQFGCYKGKILLAIFSQPLNPGMASMFHFGKAPPDVYSWWGWEFVRLSTNPGGDFELYIGVPIWSPLLAASGVALVTWKLDRTANLRARNNCCKKCGYHRAGLKPDALCPECGV